jgi:hypothetical protein
MVLEAFFSKKAQHSNNIFLGSPEAEAESSPLARVPLKEVYEDFHGIIEKISGEKFIILSRKGCGKSAFAEYIKAISSDTPNLFCDFVQQSSIQLEKLIQINSLQNEFDSSAFYRWVILIKILGLLFKNEGIKDGKEYKELKKFYSRNHGSVNIVGSEIERLIETNGFEVNAENLQRFLTLRFKREVSAFKKKAPFYKLLPNLEEVIVSVLSSPSELTNKNEYILFIDDLDIGFSAQNQEHIELMLSLLRTTKELNKVFFDLKIKAKVVLLLRNDISKKLISADSAKIFRSYGIYINWFQNGFGRTIHENETYLKRFINGRIVYAFKKAKKAFDINNPWGSLVNDSEYRVSGFDYIVENTLYRPRDLLLLFQPLDTDPFNFPLNKRDVDSLIRRYSDELVNELTNEMISFYNKEEIASIINALAYIQNNSLNSQRDVLATFKMICGFCEPQKLLDDLFERSVIAVSDPATGFINIKCREPIDTTETYSVKETSRIVLQHAIESYCSRRSSGFAAGSHARFFD